MPDVTQPWLDLRNPVSALSHLVGLLCSTAMLVYLLQFRCQRFWQRGVLAVFGVSAVCLYAASFVYHALRIAPELLIPYQLVDQSAIYLLISGTATPIMAILVKPTSSRNALLALLWGLTIAGIAIKWTISGMPYALVVAPYIAMGWISFAALCGVYSIVGIKGLRWLVYGGLCYTVGAILDALRWPTLLPGIFGSHELFHLAVLAGTTLHFMFVVKFVVPFAERGSFAGSAFGATVDKWDRRGIKPVRTIANTLTTL